MKLGFDAKTVSMIGAAAFAALIIAAPAATAVPVAPAPPPAPAPLPLPAPPPLPVPPPGPAPLSAGSAPDIAVQPVLGDAVAPAIEGVPHLPSPDNLPEGTIVAPTAPNQPRLTYLRDLWHAMQTEEVSGSDALLLLTQRPMNTNPTPPAMPAGPQAPLPVAPPLPIDAPPVTP